MTNTYGYPPHLRHKLGLLWTIEQECRRALTRTPGRIHLHTYKTLGKVVGHPWKGPWRPYLNPIRDKYKSMGCPDITVVARRGNDGYPGQVDDVVRGNRAASYGERLRTWQKMQECIDWLNPGAQNPYRRPRTRSGLGSAPE
jgi:hypothetical protein